MSASHVKQKTSEKDACGKRLAFSTREKIMTAALLLAIILTCVGFGLWGSNLVPASAAAKVDDTYITEDDVSSWIYQYRTSNGLTDDAQFAQTLINQNLNVSTFRQNVINQLSLSALINKEAQRLGVQASDADVQSEIDRVKQNLAFGDDSVWQDTLNSYGLTETKLKDQYKSNLSQKALCEKAVARRSATDEEILSYAKENLAGTTQKHAYRIVFEGEDANSRATACYKELTTAASVDLAKFQEMAKKYSDEEEVQVSAGSYAWSGGSMGSEAKEVLENVSKGAFTGAESISADSAVEIFYVDDEYTFPDSSNISNLKVSDIPTGLFDEVSSSAADAVWTSECNTYLSSLLAAAKITYYPIPDGAEYNVSMANVSASSSLDTSNSLSSSDTGNIG